MIREGTEAEEIICESFNSVSVFMDTCSITLSTFARPTFYANGPSKTSHFLPAASNIERTIRGPTGLKPTYIHCPMSTRYRLPVQRTQHILQRPRREDAAGGGHGSASQGMYRLNAATISAFFHTHLSRTARTRGTSDTPFRSLAAR